MRSRSKFLWLSKKYFETEKKIIQSTEIRALVKAFASYHRYLEIKRCFRISNNLSEAYTVRIYIYILLHTTKWNF